MTAAHNQLSKIVAIALAGATIFVAGMIAATRTASAAQVVASFYHEGKVTANGERYNPDGMTCAHRTLKFGTRLRVTYQGRSAVCRVNDRGPYIAGRGLDVSRGMARALGMMTVGVARVDMVVL
jgi:rare lipoprotein A